MYKIKSAKISLNLYKRRKSESLTQVYDLLIGDCLLRLCKANVDNNRIGKQKPEINSSLCT